MTPERTEYIQKQYQNSNEWKEVKHLSDEIFKFLKESKTIEKIKQVNKPGTSSGVIQSVFTPKLEELGFSSEKQNLFRDYELFLRPDFYKKIGTNTGVIIEVERGKTNINNMDFLDFWKCHICSGVNYLFLFVPIVLLQNQKHIEKWEKNKTGQRPYFTTNKHIEPFFQDENYTNVRGVVLFGY